jgi:hypothetical protein
VIAYLPPDESEPMALWKVLILRDKRAVEVGENSWAEVQQGGDEEGMRRFSNPAFWACVTQDSDEPLTPAQEAYGEWEPRDLEEEEVLAGLRKAKRGGVLERMNVGFR